MWPNLGQQAMGGRCPSSFREIFFFLFLRNKHSKRQSLSSPNVVLSVYGLATSTTILLPTEEEISAKKGEAKSERRSLTLVIRSGAPSASFM